MAKPKFINVSVEIGYELRTVSLSEHEWGRVKSGHPLSKEIVDYYEGEEFTYKFNFNSSDYKVNSLVVTYEDADGFIGNIEDAFISEEIK